MMLNCAVKERWHNVTKEQFIKWLHFFFFLFTLWNSDKQHSHVKGSLFVVCFKNLDRCPQVQILYLCLL